MTNPSGKRTITAGAALMAAVALPASPAFCGEKTTGTARPNILFAISDDQSWADTGANGNPAVWTPTFDRIAREGVLFAHAYCSSPSCTPSRAAILTGQAFSRLGEGGNLWSTLPARYPVYPNLLERAGYAVGHTGKGWSPGDVGAGGRKRNPAGPHYKNFETFLEGTPKGKPFCFWFGSLNPHRPYEKGSGLASGRRLSDARVPPFLPDAPEVRSDLLDYYTEIERFDREVGTLLRALERRGELDNTIVVMTSDNGMPFPRAKTNLYDSGARLPLAVRWPVRVRPGRRVEDFVSFPDFAPTFLEAAGLKPLPEMTGKSLLPILTSGKSGQVERSRDRVYIGRERHTPTRPGGVGYPMRAVRTRDYLYIRNLEPDRWPAGDPEEYGDIDGGPTKAWMKAHREDAGVRPLFDLSFGKRPSEELYDLRRDPHQLRNAAERPDLSRVKRRLGRDLDRWMKRMGDPRASGEGEVFDRAPYRTPRRQAPLKTQGSESPVENR